MPKKKSLPDRSPPVPTIFSFPTDGGLVVSNQAVEGLKRRYEFKDSYDLLTPLDETLQWFSVLQQPELSYAEQKEYLRVAIDGCAQLREFLQKMDDKTCWAIHLHWRRPTSRLGWQQRMEIDTRCMELSARRALAKMPPYSGANHAFHWLMDRLVVIYEDATDKQVTGITKDNYGDGEYSQPIVKFVEDCLTLVDVAKTNSAIGQALARAIKRRT